MVALLSLSGCSADATCDPTDPACGGGNHGEVASVVVTSPTVDTVMAVGRTAQLVAEARDAGGTAMPSVTSFSWTSLDPGVATVTPTTGLVSAVETGTVAIRVSQSHSTVTGQIDMRVVNADLTRLTMVVGDTVADAARQALSSAPRAAVATGLSACEKHVTSGNLLALNACLTNLSDVSGANGSDSALLGVLDLFFDFAKRLLNL